VYTPSVFQGSVVRALLFDLYVSPINKVITAHSVMYHQYADDAQFNVALQLNKNVTFKPVLLSTSLITALNLDSIHRLGPIGRNVMFCSRRYSFDVADVLLNNSGFSSDFIYLCATARTKVTDVQMTEVDLLFECLLI